jgi:type I restriction-modification system DNA methylase subunit
VTRLLVEMLEPYEGRVLDPACGSGGLVVQSAEFVKAHGGRARQIPILGQENNQATWRICKMNLAIHGFTPADRAETRFWSGFADVALLNRTQEVAGLSPASSMKGR